MAVNEEIVTGKKFRRLIDVATNKWRRYSFWNKAKDTECEDGTDVETKVGAIKGITTSTNVSETGYAADAKTVSELNQSLTQIKTYVGKDGNLHFVDSTGADTVIPFNSGYKEVAIAFADYQRVVACILIKPDKSVHYGWGSIQGDYMTVNASGNGNCSIIAKKAGKYLVFDTQATVPKTSTTQVDASANKTIVMSGTTTQFSINVAVAL